MRYHDGTIPVNGDKGPSERAGDDRRVDEAWVGIVAEVQQSEVRKVKNEKQLGPVEVGADKKHDKSEVEEVVEDKVTADARGGVDNFLRLGEEVTNVAKLEDKEHDPAEVVSGGEHGVVANGAGGMYVCMLRTKK